MGNSDIIAPSSNLEGANKLPVDWQNLDFIEDRVLRLKSINKVLQSRGLKRLPMLGNWKNGEVELLKIIGIFDHSAEWFVDVQFECRFPSNQLGKYAIRFDAHGEVSDGAVAYAMINGKVAVTYQWRPVVCRWTFEIPRGFGRSRDKKFYVETSPKSMELQDLPFDTLLKVIGEEIASFATINQVAVLGTPFNNTGSDFTSPTHILVDLSIDKEELELRLNQPNRFSPYRLYLFDPGEMDEEIGRKINDNHSIVAHHLATKYMRTHKFL